VRDLPGKLCLDFYSGRGSGEGLRWVVAVPKGVQGVGVGKIGA